MEADRFNWFQEAKSRHEGREGIDHDTIIDFDPNTGVYRLTDGREVHCNEGYVLPTPDNLASLALGSLVSYFAKCAHARGEMQMTDGERPLWLP